MHEHTLTHLHLPLRTALRLEIPLLLFPGSTDRQPTAPDNLGGKPEHVTLLEAGAQGLFSSIPSRKGRLVPLTDTLHKAAVQAWF